MTDQPAPCPAIILVRPQLGQNIGKVARAMLNFGLIDLRLVAPRDGWPNPDAVPSAAGADVVLENARMYDTLDAAVADLHTIYATTARPREMIKEVATPRHAASQIRSAEASGTKVGILFGPEAAGMSNDDLAQADIIISVPLNPAFTSLNLAQAVILVAYEWFQAADSTPGTVLRAVDAKPATRDELNGFFEHLEAELDRGGFLRPPEKRPTMVRNIRNIFTRAHLMAHEVSTLRGMIKAMTVYRRQNDD